MAAPTPQDPLPIVTLSSSPSDYKVTVWPDLIRRNKLGTRFKAAAKISVKSSFVHRDASAGDVNEYWVLAYWKVDGTDDWHVFKKNGHPERVLTPSPDPETDGATANDGEYQELGSVAWNTLRMEVLGKTWVKIEIQRTMRDTSDAAQGGYVACGIIGGPIEVYP